MKNKVLVILIVIIAIIAICVIAFRPDNKENKNSTTGTSTAGQAKTMQATLNDNGDIEIKADDLEQSNATFISYTSNETEMELVAIKDSQNNIDVAFNTCQVCNGSPLAYFIQRNGKLICENCGNSFSLSTIGGSNYGCNPMTIENSHITKTDSGITISKEFLAQNEGLFVNVAKH